MAGLTAKEAAKHFGISTSTVYRWVRNRKLDILSRPPLRIKVDIPEQEDDPPWEQETMNGEYPPHVHAETARADGIPPEAFRFEQWPVSDIEFGHPTHDMSSRFVLRYGCRIPSETPHANQYRADGSKVPDPVGMALAWVRFELLASDTGEKLHRDARDHVAGDVIGGLTDGKAQLWNRLTPGGRIRVKLIAYPLFYYLSEDGAAQLAYCKIGERGYFTGRTIASRVFILSMDDDGELFIDGQPRPDPPKTAEEIEFEARAERERIAHEKEQARIKARQDREKAEREEAIRLLESRRGNYDSDAAWLLGCVTDRSIPFHTRSLCYEIAKGKGIDLRALKDDRARRIEADKARKKAEFQRRQKEQRLRDDIELVKQFVDYSGGDRRKALKRLYDNPDYDRFDPAVEAVAKEWGISL